ncbi:zinc finger protein [Sesbania bispinosa]|nr:zinc finger protein [Sesbania bispinosa]
MGTWETKAIAATVLPFLLLPFAFNREAIAFNRKPFVLMPFAFNRKAVPQPFCPSPSIAKLSPQPFYLSCFCPSHSIKKEEREARFFLEATHSGRRCAVVVIKPRRGRRTGAHGRRLTDWVRQWQSCTSVEKKTTATYSGVG